MGAFFMGAIWLEPARAFCPAPAGLAMVKVRHVVDGDTLRLADGRTVRLIGINAPEIGRRGRRSEALAETARRRLISLVRENGGRVGLRLGREPRDKYGRTLAQVYGRSGDNLSARLLGEGLGYRVAVAPNVSLVGCQRQAERSAREAGLGLWRHSPVLAPTGLRRSGFAVISGKVSDVRRDRNLIHIDIDHALVVQLSPARQSDFSAAFASGLMGQRIEVRGWVLDRSRKPGWVPGEKRWLLPLRDRSMLERL